MQDERNDFAIANPPDAHASGPTSRASGEGAEAQRESEYISGTPLTKTQARQRARLMRQWQEARTPGTKSYENVRRQFLRDGGCTPYNAVRRILDTWQRDTFTSRQLVAILSERYPSIRWTPVRLAQILTKHRKWLRIRYVATRNHGKGYWVREGRR